MESSIYSHVHKLKMELLPPRKAIPKLDYKEVINCMFHEMDLADIIGFLHGFIPFNYIDEKYVIHNPLTSIFSRILYGFAMSFCSVVVRKCLPDPFRWIPFVAMLISCVYRVYVYVYCRILLLRRIHHQ